MEAQGIVYWADSIADMVKRTENNLRGFQRSQDSPDFTRQAQYEEPTLEHILAKHHVESNKSIEFLLNRIQKLEAIAIQNEHDKKEISLKVENSQKAVLAQISNVQQVQSTFINKSDIPAIQEKVYNGIILELNKLEFRINDCYKKIDQMNSSSNQFIESKFMDYQNSGIPQHKLDTLRFQTINEINEKFGTSISNMEVQINDLKSQIFSGQNQKIQDIERYVNNHIVYEIEKVKSEIHSFSSRMGMEDSVRAKELDSLREIMQNSTRVQGEGTVRNEVVTKIQTEFQKKFNSVFQELQSVQKELIAIKSDQGLEDRLNLLESSMHEHEGVQEIWNYLKSQDTKTTDRLGKMHESFTKQIEETKSYCKNDHNFQEMQKGVGEIGVQLKKRIEGVEHQLKKLKQSQEDFSQHQLKMNETVVQDVSQIKQRIEKDISQWLLDCQNRIQTVEKQYKTLEQQKQEPKPPKKTVQQITTEIFSPRQQKPSHKETPTNDNPPPPFQQEDANKLATFGKNAKNQQLTLQLDQLGNSEEDSEEYNAERIIHENQELLETDEDDAAAIEWAADFAENFMVREMERCFDVMAYTTQQGSGIYMSTSNLGNTSESESFYSDDY